MSGCSNPRDYTNVTRNTPRSSDMKLRLILAAATCLVMPLAAHAQPVTGPYVSLGGGTSIANPVGFESFKAGRAGKIQVNNSYAADTAVGYGFGNGFRIELNGDFNRNTASKIKYSNPGALGDSPFHGGMNTYGPMVNVLYHINVGLPVFPYVGVGAGYQWQKFHNALNGNFDSVHGTQGSFAYNIIAGVAYPLPWVQGLSLTGEYKFMQLTESRNYVDSLGGGAAHIGQSS